MVTANAAGPTMRKLTLNLSFIEHPWVRVAAIVVSEMNERLSPKNEPPTIMAVMNEVSIAVAVGSGQISCARPAARGTSATMVPTLVPMDIDMKHEARKSPAYIRFPGRMRSVMLTVASIAPIAFAVDANAPARINIHIIRSTFLFPAP